MILSIRTDSMDAQLQLLEHGKSVAERSWSPGRRLSNELLPEIEQILVSQNKSFTDLTGLIVFEGPGSFTSLRIGISVANALGYSLGISIVGASGEDWVHQGQSALVTAQPGTAVFPVYGAEANITKPKK